jgi:hypothetical protein
MNMGLFLIIQTRVSEVVKIVLKIQEKSGEKNYNVDVCVFYVPVKFREEKTWCVLDKTNKIMYLKSNSRITRFVS